MHWLTWMNKQGVSQSEMEKYKQLKWKREQNHDERNKMHITFKSLHLRSINFSRFIERNTDVPCLFPRRVARTIQHHYFPRKIIQLDFKDTVCVFYNFPLALELALIVTFSDLWEHLNTISLHRMGFENSVNQ